MENGILMQYFEWYLPDDCTLWKKVASDAKHLSDIGITAVWLPPAYKGAGGTHDVGYGVYDLYDLGEFDQKGGIPTKYGTREEYLSAIGALQAQGISVYADIVLNHKMGADGLEDVYATEDSRTNRLQSVSHRQLIDAWTRFTFPGRHGKYSAFTWNHTHFDGVDWDQRQQHAGIYGFDVGWDADVDGENVNYDYLMGADLSFANREVLDELDRWGEWYLDTAHMDGFRLDAVKHIEFTFFRRWLGRLRQNSGKELFAVGEYWSQSLPALQNYLRMCGGCMSLFDVPLHFKFYQACNQSGYFNMATLLDGTLVQDNPVKAVTFVENHDTQAGQALETVVTDWFRPLAYAVILLRPQGYPCIFYGDYYGVPSHGTAPMGDTLDLLCQVRRERVYGPQHDYFDHFDVVGWTLEGDEDHPGSGLAVLLSDGPGGSKVMYVGGKFAGQQFYDCTGHQKNLVKIGETGCGEFTVDGGSLSVWLPQEN